MASSFDDIYNSIEDSSSNETTKPLVSSNTSSFDDIYNSITISSPTQETQPTTVATNPNAPDQEFEMEDLDNKVDWLQQARTIYNYENPDKKFKGSNKDLSDWFKDRHSSVANNLTNLIRTGVDTANMSDEVKKAWSQSLDTYDKTNSDFATFLRATANTFADPLTYAGVVGTGGLGVLAKIAGKKGAQKGLRNLLGRFEFKTQLNKQIATETSKKAAKEFAETGASKEVTKEVLKKARKEAAKSVGKAQAVTGTAAGMGWGGGFTGGREGFEIGLDKKEDVDLLTLAIGTLGGGVLGGVAGRFLPTGIEKIGRGRAIDKIVDESVTPIQPRKKVIEEDGITKPIDDETFETNVRERASSHAKELELEGEVKINIPEGNLTNDNIKKLTDVYDTEGIQIKPVGDSKNQFIGKKIIEKEVRSVELPEGRTKTQTNLAKIKSKLYDDRGLGDAYKAANRRRSDGARYIERVVQQSWKSLEKAILKNYEIKSFKDLDDDQLAIMNEFFKGNQGALQTLQARGATDVVKELQNMRTSVQALQKDLLDSGVIDETSEAGQELIAKINKSMDGTDGELYVTRQYESFDNPDWKTDLPKRDGGKQIINDASDLIFRKKIDEYRDWARSTNNENEKLYQKDMADFRAGRINAQPEIPRLIPEKPSTIKKDELFSQAMRDVDEILTMGNADGVLNVLNKNAFPSTSSATKILTRRKSIPKQIRLLMGEYNDPFTNYANTVTSLFKTIETYKYENQIRRLIEAGKIEGAAKYRQGTTEMNVPLISTLPKNVGDQASLIKQITDIRKKADAENWSAEELKVHEDKILGQESGLIRPLQGFEAYPEVAEAIQMGNELLPVENNIYRGYLTFQGYTRAGKTIYSPTAIARNFLGSGMMALGAGYMRPHATKGIVDVLKGLKIDTAGKEADEAIEQMMARGLALGTMQSGTEFNALRGALADAASKDFFTFQSPLYKSTGEVKKLAKKYNTKMVNIYQAMDDVWKEFAFLNERDMQRQTLMDILPTGESPDDIVRTVRTAKGTEVNITKLDEYAAKLVGDHMQNYANVPIFVKRFRRWPLADFLAFKTEMARTSKNIIRNAYRDIRDGNQLMAKGEPSLDLNGNPTGLLKGQHQRSQGIKRLMSAVTTMSAVPAITATSAYLMGMDNEVGKTGYTKAEGMERILSSDWSKGHNYLYFGDPQGGKGRRINLSYINPWAAGTEMITAAARALDTGENVDNAITNAAIEGVWRPLYDTLGPSMLAGGIANLIKNENEYGQDIYDRKAQSSLDWVKQTFAEMYKAFEPGGFKSARDIYLAATYPKTKKDLFGTEGIDPEPMITSKYGVSRGKVGTKKYLQDQITALGGIKPEAYDINAIFPLKLKSLERKRRDTITKFKDVYQDRQLKTPKELVDGYKKAMEQNYSHAKDVYDLVQQYKAAASTEKKGKIKEATPADIIMAVTRGGLFKERLDKKAFRQLISGKFMPSRPNIKDMIKWQEDTRRLTGIKQPIKEAKKEIYEIYRQYIRQNLGE